MLAHARAQRKGRRRINGYINTLQQNHLFLNNREGEFDVVLGDEAVDGTEGLQLVVDLLDILRVQVDLQQLGSIESVTSTLTNDLDRVDDVLKDGAVYVGESAGTRADLGTLVLTDVVLGQNGTLGNDAHVLTRELLLQFTNQTRLDLLELLVLTVWDEDDDGGLTSGNLDFL